jgi:hypothetical protein
VRSRSPHRAASPKKWTPERPKSQNGEVTFTVPDRLAAACRNVPERARWLARLPDTLHELQQRWSSALKGHVMTVSLQRRMLQVMVSPGLERMCQQQQLRFAKQLARELQPRGGSLEEAVGQANDGMTGAIGER